MVGYHDFKLACKCFIERISVCARVSVLKEHYKYLVSDLNNVTRCIVRITPSYLTCCIY